jgi:hypothetical protein
MVVVGESDGKGDGQDKSEGEVSFFVFWFWRSLEEFFRDLCR